ncbi:phosphatidylinositol glycan, class A [Nematocida displodere]|uniref:Phosphatidylinositol glycan, class A n=1 Tax=Nematocida displodere TaxID=1805483 RepID=A0A177ECB1_9MICR|nr:phosphatidylinositol glycan, class A [Nematocida displodere]
MYKYGGTSANLQVPKVGAMYKIAMVSDFFHPRLGGVENHILNVSRELRRLGHTVIVITHANTGVSGIHYVDGFKTYYLELLSIFGGAVFPTFVCTSFYIAEILLSEQVDIVHGHQCTPLGMESVFHAKMLGLSTCFTNHSLVKVNTLGGVLTSSALQLSMADTDQIICVSLASRNNTADRLEIPPERIKVIPNAVTDDFFPTTVRDTRTEIVISVVTRLTYRKGASLLAEVLPEICALGKQIRVVIAGDGDKRELLEQTVELHNLKGQVDIIGGVDPSRVKDVLNNSDLFLNTSLTDAFCITLIEAAACGLYVVSTNVDGIGEVLPKEMVTLTSTTPESILRGIEEALPKIPKYNKALSHQRVKLLYQWPKIAKETERIYRSIVKPFKIPSPSKLGLSVKQMLCQRKDRISMPFAAVLLVNYLVLLFLLAKHANRSSTP